MGLFNDSNALKLLNIHFVLERGLTRHIIDLSFSLKCLKYNLVFTNILDYFFYLAEKDYEKSYS